MLNIRSIKLNTWEVVVPRDVHFISDWSDFTFSEFSPKCIIDKQVPGCGYTEWAIRNSFNVILASPRKMLLENKTDQHPGEVFLVRNELDRDPNVDKDVNKLTRGAAVQAQQELAIEQLGFSTPDIYDRIRTEFINYLSSRGNQPIKVLVTYDSYYLVKTILQDLGIFNMFYTVVDEYQSILTDSHFKSNTELEFMSVLKDVQYVQFISATPMLDKYTEMLDDFKNLPVYHLNWSIENPGRVVKPNLKVLVMKSIGDVLPGIIESYKNGNYEKIVTVNPNTGELKDVVSDEAVFYVNSVNHIINIIKRCGLEQNEVNILCSNTPENTKKVKTKLGRLWKIGTVPLKGVKPKMFTFCTRTVYLGADFYSSCARSFIFSDSNTDCLAIDISQDLPQILGRQRLSENPWKDSAVFYYRSTADYRKMSREDFNDVLQKKIDKTNRLMKAYQNNLSDPDPNVASDLVDIYRVRTKTESYKEDYVSVNVKGPKMIPVFNNYVYVSDIRAFDIQQIDYADRFSVFRELENTFFPESIGGMSNFMKEYKDLGDNISKRIRFICDLDSSFLNTFLENLTNDDYAKSYYLQIGPTRCKALGYNVAKIRKELGIKRFDKNLMILDILQNFTEGVKIPRSDIKNQLSIIYQKHGYNKVPKATDLEEWFETKAAMITLQDKTRIPGILIVKKK